MSASIWRGVRGLIGGFLLFVVLIGLSKVVGDLKGDFADTIGRGPEVGAWVVLWFPIDTLVFSTWQGRLDRRAYRLLGGMDLTLRPVP